MRPRATLRIAVTTSEAAFDLWMNALAPDCTAAKRAASLSSRVRKISFASGRISRMAAAASAPEPEVEQHHVGPKLGSCRDAFRHSPGRADHFHVVLVVDQRGQALSDDRVVLNDHDPDRVLISGLSITFAFWKA
jgi:hypothetical protein